MRALVRVTSCLGLAVAVIACGGPATPPTAAPTPGKPAAPPAKPGTSVAATPGATPGSPAPVVASPGAVAAAAAPALTPPAAAKYEPKGRRDPFEPLEARVGSERSMVASARLTGLVRSATTALALVETPDGIGYILKPGDTLADGRLLEIGPNMVVFGLAPKPGATTNRVVLKLASD